MGNYARAGVLCLMVLAIAVARLVEVEFRPQIKTPSTALKVNAEPEPPPPPPPVAPVVVVPEPPQHTVYVAKPGETLGAISGKVYDTSRHWKTIYDANRDVIPGPPESMRAGTLLKIPRRPK